MKQTEHQVEYRKLSDLHELKGNPRTIKRDDFEKLKTSIRNNPDYFEARPLILSDRTGRLVVLAGNQRLKAAKALGIAEVPTVLLSGLSEEREKEIVIRDNVSNGDWDMDILANEWDESALKDWGVDINWDTDTPEVTEDDVPDDEGADLIKLKPGEVYRCGNHRIMCGDSTCTADVSKLMGGTGKQATKEDK